MTPPDSEAPQICSECRSKKATTQCGICESKICKSCRHTLDVNDFWLLEVRPEILSHAAYCSNCYDPQIYPVLMEYKEFELKAYDTYFLTKNHRGDVQIKGQHPKAVYVHKCADRRQMILMLAYQAAKLGYNAIIGAEIKSKKVVAEGGYQSSVWSGSAIPANINGPRLELAGLKGF